MLTALTLLIAAQGAGAQQPINVETNADGGYRITAADPISLDDLPKFNERLQVMGRATCGALTLRWGRFTHHNVPGPDGTVLLSDLVQQFKCIDPATDPYKPVSADWQPSPEDEAAAAQVGARYIQAILDGNADEGVALLDPEIAASREDWLAFVGPGLDPGPGSAQLTAQQWFANPEGLPYPGAYTSQFYRGEFDEILRGSGALSPWSRKIPGRTDAG